MTHSRRALRTLALVSILAVGLFAVFGTALVSDTPSAFAYVGETNNCLNGPCLLEDVASIDDSYNTSTSYFDLCSYEAYASLYPDYCGYPSPVPPSTSAPTCNLDLTKDKITWSTTNVYQVLISPLTNSPQIPGYTSGQNQSTLFTETQVYNSSAVINDMAYDGVSYNTPGQDPAGFYADALTMNRVCELMLPGSTANMSSSATGADDYSSPGGNSVVYWTGSTWAKIGASAKNWHLRYQVTCEKPGSATYPFNGSYNFVPPLSVGTHTYQLTANGTGGTKTCTATVTVPPPTPTPAPTCNLDLTKDKITWSTTNVYQVLISPLTNSPQIPGLTGGGAGQTVAHTESEAYLSTAVIQDMQIDGINLPSVQGNTGFAGDQATMNRVCVLIDGPGSTAGTFYSEGYSSPSNNAIVKWNGSSWSRISASSFNNHLRYSFNCTKPSSLASYPFSGYHNFVPPLSVGTHTYQLTANGTGGTKTCTATVTVPPPTQASCTVSANPSNIAQGSSSTLTWNSTGVQNCSGANFNTNGATSGTTSVTPNQTTAYSMTCSTQTPPQTNTTWQLYEEDWTDYFCSANGMDNPNTNGLYKAYAGVPNCSLGNPEGSACNSPAGICKVNSGQCIIHTKLYRCQAPGTSTSSAYPSTSQTVQCQTTVTVAPSAPTCTLTASPTSIYEGSSTTLSWTSSNASSISISSGVGSVTPVASGSKSVSPTQTTTYTATVTGTGGTATCTQKVIVNEPPVDKFCKLEITKSVNKITVGANEYVEFTLNFKNVGTKNCTGGGVKVWDKLDPIYNYQSETHSSNVTAGYGSDPVYKASDRTVRFNADTLTPGESGWAKIKVKTGTPSSCAYDYPNQAKITSYEYNNFQEHEASNTVYVEVTKDCTPPPVKECKLVITKSADKTAANVGEYVEYTINFKNEGDLTCTGGGVHVVDVVDSRLEYKSETHSSDVDGGYGSDSVYKTSTRTLQWNAHDLTPGESGWVKWKAKVGTPTQCTEVVPNKAKITAKELNNFNTWVESNTVNVSVSKDCSPTYGPYCGDGMVNQEWEQCDGGLTCNDKCQYGNQCAELVLARINVTDVRNSLTHGGDMTSDIFIGGNQTANKIPENVWFALFYNGTYYDDADMNAYENVPGLAVERENGKVRARMFGSYAGASLDSEYNEHIEGYLELWQADVTSQVNDVTNNNSVEGPFDSVKALKASKDELWISYGKSYFWLSVNNADDSFFTLYDEDAPSCNVPEPECTLEADPTTIQQGSSSNLKWTTTNATSISIDNGVGSVTPVPAGTKSVSPAETTLYKATVTGPGGVAYCKAKIYVTPKPNAPVCTMSLSPTTINAGGSSTLSWTSSNVTSAVINNGIGSVVFNGSTSVSTSTSATYVGTFTGPGGTVTCNASLTVHTPNPQCTLSVNKSNIRPGESVILSWTSSNVSSGSANGNVGTLSPVSSGSTETFPSDDFTYIATFTGPHGNVECRATVDVTTTTSGCQPGTCPGGFDAPTTVLFQKPGDQPLAFVYLSQIPYTGFEAGAALTLIFWLTVALIAAVSSYYVMGAGGLRYVMGYVSGFAGVPTEEEIAEAEERERERAQVYGAPYPVVEAEIPVITASVATLPAVTVIPMQAPVVVEKAPAPAVNGIPELTDVIESRAHAAGVLISPEAVEMAAELSPDRAEALRIFGEIVNEAVRTIPREDGWVMLTSDRFETFASTRRVQGTPVKKVDAGSVKTYVLGEAVSAPSYTKAATVDEAAALAFSGAILSGDRDTAFAIIRSLEHDNVTPTALMTSTASVLDRLYRARRGGTNGIDAELLAKATNVSDETLHKVVEVITHSLDALYSNPFTGVKLALAQAFEIIG